VSLTDVVSHAGFAGYAQVGFVVSLVAFLGLVVWVVLRPKADMQAQAKVVLDDDEPASNRRQP
jgi:cbb3-type cytochrome oxidase subunit 3